MYRDIIKTEIVHILYLEYLFFFYCVSLCVGANECEAAELKGVVRGLHIVFTSLIYKPSFS